MRQRKLSTWGILFLSLLGVTFLGGVIGCYRKYQHSKRKDSIRFRTLSAAGRLPPDAGADPLGKQPIAIKQRSMSQEEADNLSERYRNQVDEEELRLIRQENGGAGVDTFVMKG